MRARIPMIAVLACMSATALAHHSMGTYDQSTLVTIRGAVTKVDWMNPHVVLHLNVTAADGRTVDRRVELAGPNALLKRSFDRNLIVIGEVVTLEAWLSKDPKYGGINGRTLTLPDGRRFDVGDNWP